MERINTIIIGGGQAGLALSYYLQQIGNEHIVLEAADKPAHAWRDQRWDSFSLITPNRFFLLPGAEYFGGDRDGFLSRDEVVRRIEQYTISYRLPIHYRSRVLSVEREENDGNYLIRVDGKTYSANNVIVATGVFQKAQIPAFATSISRDILQIHWSQYKNPQSIPGGATLIVGSAQSGTQIAEDLQQSGRKLYLCAGSAGRMPQRYRGRDHTEWLNMLGFFDRTVNDLPSPAARFRAFPYTTGNNVRHTINLNMFHRKGMTLLGHACGYRDGKLILAPDLKQSLTIADQFESVLLKLIDKMVEMKGLQAPEEQVPLLTDAMRAPEILELDLKASGISAIIWATGCMFDYSMVKLPIFDAFGYPITQRGVTQYPGLYFVGLPWMDSMKNGMFLGIKENAEYIAKRIEQKETSGLRTVLIPS